MTSTETAGLENVVERDNQNNGHHPRKITTEELKQIYLADKKSEIYQALIRDPENGEFIKRISEDVDEALAKEDMGGFKVFYKWYASTRNQHIRKIPNAKPIPVLYSQPVPDSSA